jgi:hypothetical protein
MNSQFRSGGIIGVLRLQKSGLFSIGILCNNKNRGGTLDPFFHPENVPQKNFFSAADSRTGFADQKRLDG